VSYLYKAQFVENPFRYLPAKAKLESIPNIVPKEIWALSPKPVLETDNSQHEECTTKLAACSSVENSGLTIIVFFLSLPQLRSALCLTRCNLDDLRVDYHVFFLEPHAPSLAKTTRDKVKAGIQHKSWCFGIRPRSNRCRRNH
jgi:hypothetical protein